MGKEDQQIIVVEREILFSDENYFQGFRHADEFNYEGRILENLKSMRRGNAEQDPSHKQPIGYMLVANPLTKQVFAYQRSSKDEHYSEKRLQGKWSWGVGGHIEPMDKGNPIRESMMREIEEEVRDQGNIMGVKVLGYINDDNDDVGKVHFGVLYLIEVDGNPKPRDNEMMRGELMNLNQLEEICSSADCTVESWSQIAMEPLRKYLGESL